MGAMLLLYAGLLLLSFYLLAVICDEFFIESLDRISERLKLSSDVAGATLMAVGSSAPELFTSLIAVLRPGDHADIGAGTIVGSAIFNILVIIGASSMFRRAKLNWQPVVRDTLFYCVSIVALLIVFWDGQVVLAEALFFISLYIGYLLAVINWRKWFPYHDSYDPIEAVERAAEKNFLARKSKHLLAYLIPDPKKYPEKYILTFSLSILMIGFLSFILVEAAVGIGQIMMISPVIIALTVLAIGTSIPDLLSSVVVAKQGRGDMAVSNAVGSNIFDILFGLGVPWTIVLLWQGGSVVVSNENLISSVILLLATVLAIFFLLLVRNWTIGRRAGLVLIGTYLIYLGWSVWQTLG
jgi:K+-dependent Na+/Ca+ exchanger-like protein